MHDRADSKRSRRAIAISIATHLVALGAVGLVLAGHGRYDGALGERPIHIASLTIEHRHPPRPRSVARPAAVRAISPAPRAPREVAIHRYAPALIKERSGGGATLVPVEAALVVPKPVPAVAETAPPQAQVERVAVLSPHEGVAAAPTVTPSASPEPTAAPSAAAVSRGSGIPGGFGQNLQATFYQQASTSAIRARLAARDVILIRVDETGHATDVQFVRFSGDVAARGDLRETLLAMRYLPAECDGMRCAGSVELKL